MFAGTRIVLGLAALLGALAGPPPSMGQEPVRAAAPRETWRVLVIRGWDAQFPANAERERALREALVRDAPRIVDFYFEEIDALRIAAIPDAELIALLRKKYANNPPDLVIATGAEPLAFAIQHRATLWPGKPVVFNGVIDGAFDPSQVPADITGLFMALDVPGTLRLARQLQPEARDVYFASGTADFDRFYLGLARKAMPEFLVALRFHELTGLSADELASRVSKLGPGSIVLYLTVLRDGRGQLSGPGADTFARVSKASAVPVYSAVYTQFSRGPVGGSASPVDRHGAEAGRIARHLLEGAAASQFPAKVWPAPECVVDWRALQRYRLDERRVPAACEVRHRPPPLSAADLLSVIAVASVILLQAGLISALVVQSRRRRRAEEESRRRSEEMAHAARLSVMGELTASIAHEINQPLGAILGNAEALDILLEKGDVDVASLRAIVADIRSEDQRASDVVKGLRALLAKHELRMERLDVNALARDVLQHFSHEGERRHVRITPDLEGGLPAVLGNSVHVQQVLINLVMNGLEAVVDVRESDREVCVRTRQVDGGCEVAVMDSGPGIPAGREEAVFDSFVTTKSGGMGLGLSIVRTIVERYGGYVRASRGPLGGAMIRVWLPAAPP